MSITLLFDSGKCYQSLPMFSDLTHKNVILPTIERSQSITDVTQDMIEWCMFEGLCRVLNGMTDPIDKVCHLPSIIGSSKTSISNNIPSHAFPLVSAHVSAHVSVRENIIITSEYKQLFNHLVLRSCTQPKTYRIYNNMLSIISDENPAELYTFFCLYQHQSDQQIIIGNESKWLYDILSMKTTTVYVNTTSGLCSDILQNNSDIAHYIVSQNDRNEMSSILDVCSPRNNYQKLSKQEMINLDVHYKEIIYDYWNTQIIKKTLPEVCDATKTYTQHLVVYQDMKDNRFDFWLYFVLETFELPRTGISQECIERTFYKLEYPTSLWCNDMILLNNMDCPKYNAICVDETNAKNIDYMTPHQCHEHFSYLENLHQSTKTFHHHSWYEFKYIFLVLIIIVALYGVIIVLNIFQQTILALLDHLISLHDMKVNNQKLNNQKLHNQKDHLHISNHETHQQNENIYNKQLKLFILLQLQNLTKNKLRGLKFDTEPPRKTIMKKCGLTINNKKNDIVTAILHEMLNNDRCIQKEIYSNFKS